MMFITVHPHELAPAVLSSVDLVVVVGDSPAVALEALARVPGEAPPAVGPLTLRPGDPTQPDLILRTARGGVHHAMGWPAAAPATHRNAHLPLTELVGARQMVRSDASGLCRSVPPAGGCCCATSSRMSGSRCR